MIRKLSIAKVTIFFILVTFNSGAFATQDTITGKVKKIRLHQYLSGQSWDDNIWFCLDNAKVVGTCAVTHHCNNHTQIVISKNAQPQLYSSVLAAKISQSSITVYVDDSFKFGDACYARIVDIE